MKRGDYLEIVGMLIIVASIGLWSLPAAGIVGGLALILIAQGVTGVGKNETKTEK